MTNEQAIRELNRIYMMLSEDMKKALDMAIKALEQEPKTGHWIDMDEGFSPCECSECKSVEFIKSKFCPNCGCRMVSPQESDHKCHTCKHYTSGERDGSCGSYICKNYSNWERSDKE